MPSRRVSVSVSTRVSFVSFVFVYRVRPERACAVIFFSGHVFAYGHSLL